MRTNTISRAIYDTLPHQIGQKVSVRCHDGQWKEGKIHNMIGHNNGTSYTMNIKIHSGVLVTTAPPENVIVL